ncbi:hypothetical protein F4680DRAFT_443178 [Xylaria scruposa]|nr:hypothetical protein F4680DRAFT_443178 [Xylaria scruposa]
MTSRPFTLLLWKIKSPEPRDKHNQRMNNTTETLANAAWPFYQEPLNLGDLENHPILLTVADRTDLDALADFAADSHIAIKQAGSFGPLQDPSGYWLCRRQRYRCSFQAIMESCIPNEMTGAILKVEHRGVIKGMMTLNLAQTDHGDPWTRQYAQLSPDSKYLKLLFQIMEDNNNDSRPILNVPNIFTSMDGHYRTTCLTAFTNILVRIAHACRYTILMKIYHGSYHYLFKTPVTDNTGFVECLQTFGEGFQPQRYWPYYGFYMKYCPRFIGIQQTYLDRALREAFEYFDCPLRPSQRTRDELSPVPSLVSDSDSGDDESIASPGWDSS